MSKKRAVSRGEDHRRSRERRKEVERSRAAWRARALTAEQRMAPLARAPHQLHSALTQARQPHAIDHTHFFCAIFLSLLCCTVTCLSARRAACSVHCLCLLLA